MKCEDPYSFWRILEFILVTSLLSSSENTDSEIQVITSVIISAGEIQRFCVVFMLRTWVQWGNTCRRMVLCYAEKDGLHVVAYYEHWSVNEVYNKTSVYSWSNRNSTNKSWGEMYYPFLNNRYPYLPLWFAWLLEMSHDLRIVQFSVFRPFIRAMDERLLFRCLLSCVRKGLAKGWFLVRRVLPKICKQDSEIQKARDSGNFNIPQV